ncbi:NAD(P)/FAD-dependent oxidoreductase [Haloarchaeobius iranensis]|uniref:Dehydrogenase (Flavoprotein) n=1 Tax=Haloarchaeobius iranensis TaxID=996166 RepID=A0A1G9UYW3_9EURY|nr:oxidoreductase [Haloarchaeobius iranensis]SDM65020.1 Dehydrogenase (flavoprotein) [Haloarchaeobius iranensis]
MTLANVPRYEESTVARQGDHAVVVGASMAGLVAARTVADAFDRVTVLDRDALADDPVPRRGVPQGHQPHVLLEAGRATLADLFPSFAEELLSNGGLVLDWTHDLVHYEDGGYLEPGPRRRPMYAASRPLFEAVTRRCLAAVDGVRLRPECRFVDYQLADAGTAVDGVVVESGRSDGTSTLPADLVVDATGRTSRTPAWLAEHGYERPPEEEVTVDVRYSTAVVDRPSADRRAFFVPPTAPRTRGGGAFPVEGDRWLVTLQGVHGDDPPTEPEGLHGFADSLPVDHLARLLDEREWVGDGVESYPFPSNVRRYYEQLDRFPDGLVVLGDAVASFNPVYGQGMSVASLEALVLHHTLADGGLDGLGVRFFDRASEVVDVAWSMAVGSDLGYAATAGSQSVVEAAFTRYLARLVRTAQDDATVADAYGRVVTMEEPPTSLLSPALVARVLSPR